MAESRSFINLGRLGYGTLIGDNGGTAVAVMYGPSVNPNAAQDTKLFLSAPFMRLALQQVLPFMEEAERKGLIGHEGCFWPVELVREALAASEVL